MVHQREYVDFPESVEEAAALLGATITLCGTSKPCEALLPPKGMHHAFAVTQPIGSELISRLHILRAMLRTARTNSEKVQSAPSILQVLKKLFGISTQLAAAPPPSSNVAPHKIQSETVLILQHKRETPPMWSTPCRRLWCECVTLCFAVSPSKATCTQFVRQMLALASIHPRSAKAAGGVRIAALEVIGNLFENEELADILSPWSLDVLVVCLKALRSAGNGEPTYREAAIKAACATATSCHNSKKSLEEKAIAESVKVLRQAVLDKFPEIRTGAAIFANLLAPLLVTRSPTDPLVHLEEVLQIATRNIDDESAFTADRWALAVARCLHTAVLYHTNNQDSAERSSPGSEEKVEQPANSSRFANARRPPTGLAHTLTTSKKAVKYLVENFIKVGGEAVASRAGGSFSVGGRAVRLGYCLVLSNLLRLETIGEGYNLTISETTAAILEMAGEKFEEQLAQYRGTRNFSKNDAALVRLFAGRVLRRGLSEGSPESVQLSIFHELVHLLVAENALNTQQKRVVLVEVSHLVSTLGEAVTASLEETLSALTSCLPYAESGVRHEAAVACLAVTKSCPSHGSKLLASLLSDLRNDVEKLTALSKKSTDSSEKKGVGMRMFRRSPAKNEKSSPNDVFDPVQNAIHGKSLLVAMLVRELPKFPCALGSGAFSDVFAVSSMLTAGRYDGSMANQPDSACICVRAGFSVISGLLSTGPGVIDSYIPKIVALWQKSIKVDKNGEGLFSPQNDLDCIDAALMSVVVFLKCCSELLLMVPQALNQVTVLLEDIFSMVKDPARFQSTPPSPLVALRLDSVTASLLEAFAWLPSGSFPMVADEVFSLASARIEKAVEGNVNCSILGSLVSKEDCILDSRTFCRATLDGEVGNLVDLEESIITLSSQSAIQIDRESVLHLQTDDTGRLLFDTCTTKDRSCILEWFSRDAKPRKPPTPLHEVGTWRRPVDPSCSVKVRVVDAAIQAFSATFGLKDGSEQQRAVDMLESLVPPLIAQLARTIGISAASNELERRTKGREDSAAIMNITAVLLSCLQALPLHEATHNVPITLGPPWMNKAKDLLLTLLPSGTSIVRRAAAEALALLATLGVTEDAHFLQSTLLHSLDEVMQGNKPDGKARTIALEPISAARSGSLHTLACIQRTARNIATRKMARARGRKQTVSSHYEDDDLPLLQMMTRILPSASCHGFRDYFVVKAYAIHSFVLLLIYSGRLEKKELGDDELQLLRKAVELVEDNFFASWAAASLEKDKGQEGDIMASEVAFLSVILRSMALLVPFLYHLKTEDKDLARRFAVMATVIVESHGCHPSLFVEALAVFEVLANYKSLLAKPSRNVVYNENALFACLPSIQMTIESNVSDPASTWHDHFLLGSQNSTRASVHVIRVLAENGTALSRWTNMLVVTLLLNSLESVSAASTFGGNTILRSMVVGREFAFLSQTGGLLEAEIVEALQSLLMLETKQFGHCSFLVRWCLLCRHVLAPFSHPVDEHGEPFDDNRRNAIASRDIVKAIEDASLSCSPARWQVKCAAAQLATEAVHQLVAEGFSRGVKNQENSQFDVSTADRIINGATRDSSAVEVSSLAFHLEQVVACACKSSIATLDKSELRILQENALKFLNALILAFGAIKDHDDETVGILSQYSTQIFASVKHALASSDDSMDGASQRVFVAGCEALLSILEMKVSPDPTAVNRLIRPAMPPADHVAAFSCTEGYAGHSSQRLLKAVRVGSLWVASSYVFTREVEEIQSTADNLGLDVFSLAVHAASLASDGCRILFASGLSLVGLPLFDEESKEDSGENNGEDSDMCFYFGAFQDFDDFTKGCMINVWSSCCKNAVVGLVYSLHDEHAEINEDVALSWLEQITPLLFAGVYDAMNEGATEAGSLSSTSNSWAGGMRSSSVLCDCLQGITALIRPANHGLNVDMSERSMRLAPLIFDSVLMPVVVGECEREGNSAPCSDSVVAKACDFIHTLSADNAKAFSVDALLYRLLQPLHAVESDSNRLKDTQVADIVAMSLLVLGQLIRSNLVSESVISAILCFLKQALLNKNALGQLKVASNTVLVDCFNSSPAKKRGEMMNSFVKANIWEGWTTLCFEDDVVSIEKSLKAVEDELRNGARVDQIAALAAIRSVLQQKDIVDTKSVIVARVVPEALCLFLTFGTSPKDPDRTTVCTEATKVLISCYQQVSTHSADEDTTAFLMVLFEALLGVLRYNGLPNHPSPEETGDPTLGRLAAQTILHVARTTPVPFKSCVAAMADHDRQLTEFAVRAELGGYAATTEAAPTKKKLNLSGFKK